MFVDYKYIQEYFKNKRVVIIGSAPNVLNNDGRYIDGFDSVVRVNNYKIFPENTGKKTDVHYAFYGSSIRKAAAELKGDGVKLCMCKCPNGKPIQSAWHERNGQTAGIDFRYIYKRRAPFWFCPTYIPTEQHFMRLFLELEKHIASTGFAAIWEILQLQVKELYITGFDFFTSRKHNINERWREGRKDDPIKHVPEVEKTKILEYAKNDKRIVLDNYLRGIK